METLKLVFVTHSSKDEAIKLAKGIVENKLAACANILPDVTSVYAWQGKLNVDPEVLMVIKCPTSRVAELQKYVIANHPYDTPEFVVVDISSVSEKYLDWAIKSCRD